MENKYAIIITGKGTLEDIKSALKDVITSLDNPDNNFENNGEIFEDKTLYTEVIIINSKL